MSELQVIESALQQAARRRRLERALNGFVRGLLAGGILALLVLLIYKVAPIPAWMLLASAIAAGALALGGLVWGVWRKMSLLETARWVDERKNLKERLSTSLEVSGSRAPEDWKQLLLADAAQHARSLDAKELLPLGFPRSARWALLVAVLCVGLGFVPAYRSKAHVQKQQDAANIKDVGKNLSDLMRRELAQKPPALPPTEKSMQQVAEFGDKLGKQTLTRSEALRDLTSITEQLAKQEQELARNPALKPLERSAREPGNGGSSPESLQKQIESMQKALGDAAANADKLDKLAKDLEKFKQQAASTASKDAKAGSAAREQLAQSLADLARQAREAGASLESLEEAIKALESNNTDLFVKDLETATHDLEKLRDMAKAMQQLQEQAAKLGKDLAEQLEKGQGKAAIETLQKMIDQLKAANLSPEQLEKIMKETQKAAKPGSQYGKVGELLNKAAQQCKGGNQGEAGESLAQAQDELQKLMDQMADAEALEATLDALNRAQMAISQCKSWGQCEGACRPGFRPGGKPGRGVGTWADEYGWTYFNNPNQDAGWDNSGIERPDMEARGHKDRPDDLNPNLTPDKVKGQMSPGGSMPSITLKGVSIKGTSNVKFEEAAAAAQQDAQSALNQDQVPRAYQSAVRDYFDDLKK
jgi:DNA repair exonuclease SbcCD ATPase subunit